MLTPVCLTAVVLLAYATHGPSEPVVAARSVPAGYRAVTDAYFGYAVPKGWAEQAAWTDQTGDFLYGSPGAFAAETLAVPRQPPTAKSAPPQAFADFGLDVPSTVQVIGVPRRIAVPGTAAAWEMRIARPGGFVGTAVDVWEASTTTQLWLLVHAPAGITAAVLHTLQG